MSPKKSKLPFLSLPSELRNLIYQYCLIDENDLRIEARTKAYRRIATIEDTSGLVPEILLANRQINAEASAVLYGQPLTFINTSAQYLFLCQIGPVHRGLLQDITIERWCEGRALKALNHPAFTMLADAHGLRNVNVDGLACRYRGNTARSFYMRTHVWLHAFGAARGKNDAVLDILYDGEPVDNGKGMADWYYKELKERREMLYSHLRKLLAAH